MAAEIRAIRNWFLDMDGTVYLGNELIPGARAFIEKVRAGGGRVIFLTNNSSRSPRDYAEKLGRLGIETPEEDVFTSGDAAALMLARRFGRGARGYVLGTPSLEDLLRREGFALVGENADPQFVLLGFDQTLTYEKLRIACDYLFAGVPFFATHPDRVCPTERGFIPDAGAMLALFRTATGAEAEIAGKPERMMAEAAFARYGIAPEETAMVGDRLSTDIAFANRSGLTAVLVLSGETSAADYAAQRDVRADYIFDSVNELRRAVFGPRGQERGEGPCF